MRGSIIALVAVTVVSLLLGFVWLPSAHSDFTAKGLWDAICRAAGVPASWGGGEIVARKPGTSVVLLPEMARAGTSDAAGRGASLALEKCTMCHGARGVSAANAPNLAGQYPEVIIKQMLDYKRGDRASAAMQALATPLDEKQIRELAAYYASLPRPRNTPFTDMSKAPPLVRVGAPMRNIAPCASCHGGMEQKLGAPWLEGMPKEYLVAELSNFAQGRRTNDSHAQMRNMARALTAKEIEEVSGFYARPTGE
jgi:cytochrome c553